MDEKTRAFHAELYRQAVIAASQYGVGHREVRAARDRLVVLCLMLESGECPVLPPQPAQDAQRKADRP